MALVVVVVFVIPSRHSTTALSESPSLAQGAGDTVKMSAETRQCIACHQEKGITAAAIRDWKRSTHAVNEVGCEKCHLPAADAAEVIRKTASACKDPRVRSKVSARNCTFLS